MATHDPTCPTCEATGMEPTNLEPGLKAQQCPACKGCWVNGMAYFDWLASKASEAAPLQPDRNDDAAFLDLSHDSDAGKLCLDCGRFMRRVAVGYDKPFHLDRCVTCGGFWFDANEWAALRGSGMHRQAHRVFTDAWQAEVRRQVKQQADGRRLTDRLGEDGVARLEEIKRWIHDHPRGEEILARLTAITDD